ncbi:MAG TPA: hypothetical protein DCX53_12965 [Anaerolineae bacterium]|nr:hypothetical protein [Anaerolineae bacterium]
MKDITSSLFGMSLSILLIPVGFYLGTQVANWAGIVSGLLTDNWIITAIVLAGSPFVLTRGARWALPQKDITNPSPGLKAARQAVLIVLSFIFILVLYLISYVALTAGTSVGLSLGSFGFLGFFVRDLGDILNMLVKAFGALAGAGIFSSLAGRWGEALSRGRGPLLRLLHIVLAVAAGIMLALLLASAINWLYQFKDLDIYFMRAGGIGAVFGLLASLRYKYSEPVPTGLTIYYVSRTIFNVLRSVEALVMAIVFVVWVGIGPFAGSLALALHTIAALAKLYSEQVESIMSGPLEAVQATGATRLQTIVYAVLPQIIPPYISFTMYRWDINVRMSTIIGFVGGGGIGFLLQQNINLLNYRDASAQMLAIAIVVSLMDFVSSKIREKYV